MLVLWDLSHVAPNEHEGEYNIGGKGGKIMKKENGKKLDATPKMNKRQLTSNPFVLRSMEDMKTLTQKAGKELALRAKKGKSLRKKKDPANLQLPDSYYHAVFSYTTRLIDTLEYIGETLEFLRISPNQAILKKYVISKERWTKYHYAIFVVMIYSLYDIALILTNYVFMLGIPERYCKPHLITSNAWVHDTKVNKQLQAMEKVVGEYRELRNYGVHRGQQPEIEELQDFEPISFLKSVGFVPKDVMDAADKGYTACLQKKNRELKAKYEKCIKIVYDLFTELLPHYEAQCEQLEKSNNFISN